MFDFLKNLWKPKCYFCGKPAVNNNMCKIGWGCPGVDEKYNFHFECLTTIIHKPSHDYEKNKVALDILEVLRSRSERNKEVIKKLETFKNENNK